MTDADAACTSTAALPVSAPSVAVTAWRPAVPAVHTASGQGAPPRVTVARALSSSRTVPSAAARNTPIGTVVPAVAVSEAGTTIKWSGATTSTVVTALPPVPPVYWPEIVNVPRASGVHTRPAHDPELIVSVPRASGVHTRPAHDPELIENVLDAVTSAGLRPAGVR